jgi:hypothetical protein
MFCSNGEKTLQSEMLALGIGMWLSGRVLAYHVQGPTSFPSTTKNKTKQKVLTLGKEKVAR